MDIFEEPNAALSTNEIGFAWENRYAQSWEILKEDEHGSLKHSIAEIKRNQYIQQRRLIADKALRRGILRHLILLMDFSTASNENDYLPTRGKNLLGKVRKFSQSYFDQNPLSQLGVLALRDGLAEKISDMLGNYKDFQSILPEDYEGKGEASVLNALNVAKSMLLHTPGHGSREILLLFTGISSSDSGNIETIMQEFKQMNIKISCISLTGEIFVIKKLCEMTGGHYHVTLNDDHLVETLNQFVIPQESSIMDKGTLSYLVLMGFPQRIQDGSGERSLCSCHRKVTESGYSCPRCSAKICQVPADCPICGLTLVTAPYLAKSYHHLFPVSNFKISKVDGACYSCSRSTIESSSTAITKVGGSSVTCLSCTKMFCADCDLFIHEQLFNCPGCIDIDL